MFNFLWVFQTSSRMKKMYINKDYNSSKSMSFCFTGARREEEVNLTFNYNLYRTQTLLDRSITADEAGTIHSYI